MTESRARNGAPHARDHTLLQQARGTEACNRICDRYGLPLKDPASHRIAQRRIANVDDLHGSPKMFDAFSPRGNGINCTIPGQNIKQAPVGQ